ncbi:MAG: FKBP-type peptidyl-prolyl cis-trans isomerase [Candidatus Saccharibacteria bacterium]|nr:FKBP-type peptidyl-prolyl cis-trans isomerase [Candidatus Saccharibacteria bacterium]
MNESELKTSTKQRVMIGIIAGLMLISTIAVYALIVLNGNNSNKKEQDAEATLAEYEEKLTAMDEELASSDEKYSKKFYNTLSKYRSQVKSFNATTANNAGLKKEDLVKGTGAEIKEDEVYSVYYIGWCADESVFDSSFDNWEKPSALKRPFIGTYKAESNSTIQGWRDGIVGMKAGGIRKLEIPGELAYGENSTVCNAENSPLKYIVYAIDTDEDYKKKVTEYNELYSEYQYTAMMYYYSQSSN